MKVFGTVCYALVRNPKKLDDMSQKGIFLGHDRNSPAYLIDFPDSNNSNGKMC